jgi:hypothetical protein
MFLRTIIPVWAVLFCACVGATNASAQEDPSEEQLESARQRLQQALENGALPPAAFESDPVPDWAVPNHTPNVLPEPDMTAQPAQRANTERANSEVVDPNILSSQNSAVEKPAPEKPAAIEEPKPRKPTVARKKDAPKLKTGRAAAGAAKAKPKPEKPKSPPVSPPAPTLVLPEGLRP